MTSAQSAIRELLRIAPVLTSVESQLLLRDAYETTYGIHDHAKNVDDMALVRFRECESVEPFDPTRERLRAYWASGVLKYTGITFDRFLDLPRYRAEGLITSSMAIQKEELDQAAAELARIEEEKRKKGMS